MILDSIKIESSWMNLIEVSQTDLDRSDDQTSNINDHKEEVIVDKKYAPQL